MPRPVIALSPAVMLLLVACAQPPGGLGQPPQSAHTRVDVRGSAPAAAITPGVPADPGAPPRWRRAQERTSARPTTAGVPAFGADHATPSAGDPLLRRTVAARCAGRPANVTEISLLAVLVADLQTDGVPPTLATDALISGRCGDLADVVSEVVARYGPEAAVPVIERAVARSGDAAALIIERAAAEGLLRAGAGRMARAGASPVTPGGGDDALLYLPSGGATERRTDGLDRLLGNAEPGYGIYTYILSGDPADFGAGAHAGTYDELLRVLETYVLAAGPGGAPPAPSAHTFLVPVRAGRTTSPLDERTSPELSALLRRILGQYLRRAGEPAVAARLATAPGPFLVSSLEPRLVPRGADHVRMLVDLSRVGREHMYSVVDAYDRAIPPDVAGRVDSLRAVRSRLVDMVPDPAIDAAAARRPAAGDWVFMLARASAGAAAAGPSPSLSGAVQQGR